MRSRLKSALKNFNNGERGAVFPIVLIVLLLAGLMVPPLMSLISTSLVAGKTYETNSYELYAADAGVMDATWFLQGLEDPIAGELNPVYLVEHFGEDGTGTYTYTLPETVNGKTVSYEIVLDPVDLENPCGFIVTSTATGVDGSTTTIKTRVHYQPPLPPMMMAAGATDGNLTLGGDMVAGKAGSWLGIYANGNINMNGGVQVFGNAYYTAGHTVTEPSSGMLWGEPIETPELELVEGAIPTNPIELGPLYISGSKNIFTSQELGPIYIMGDLHIGGAANVTLTGTVWVTGKIVIDGTSTVQPADGEMYWMISEYTSISSSDLAIKSIGGFNTTYYDYKIDAIMVALNGNIYIGGGANINGSAIGTSADIIGTSNLTYPLPFKYVEIYRPLVKTYWKII